MRFIAKLAGTHGCLIALCLLPLQVLLLPAVLSLRWLNLRQRAG